MHLASRRFLSLSYGERRVILMARALVSRPRLLLLDEILNGLDASNRARILAWLARQTRRLPWVFATHRIEDVPAAVTHTLILHGGRVVYRGPRTGAPLTKWLGAPARAAGRVIRPRARAGRELLRLTRGRVYLDQSRSLAGVSLVVRGGECWVVHGRNGSGKTTLLRTLYGDHGVAVGGSIARAGVAAGVPLEVFKKRVGLVAPHLQADYPGESTVAEVVQSGRLCQHRAERSAERGGPQRGAPRARLFRSDGARDAAAARAVLRTGTACAVRTRLGARAAPAAAR